MVRAIEERRYPHAKFWSRLLAASGVAGINVLHDQGFSEYHCPDGSHLDMRDRARFTHELAVALRQRNLNRSRQS